MAVAPSPLESLSGSDNSPGRLAFWGTQAAVWSLIHGVLFIPNRRLASALELDTTHVICMSVHSTVMAVLFSTALAKFYEWVPERFLRGARAIGTVLGACVATSAVWHLATVATSPLFTLTTKLSVVQENTGTFHLMFIIRGAMLLATWSAVFLVMLLGRRVQAARERAIYAASLVHASQLELLRSQLNPHFLFNALNSVVALISEEPKRAQAMVRDIATLLRRALDGARDARATVADEMEFIELYLRCERVRFEDRLQVEVDVPDALMSRPLPSMLLHPLVENAIKHGMQGREPLRLQIVGREQDGKVVLEVRNSGSLSSPRITPKPGTGTGLKSVQERLRSLFPHDGDFELLDDEGWVTARIRYTPSPVIA
jgi:sensor histidine kinase YesM